MGTLLEESVASPLSSHSPNRGLVSWCGPNGRAHRQVLGATNGLEIVRLAGQALRVTALIIS